MPCLPDELLLCHPLHCRECRLRPQGPYGTPVCPLEVPWAERQWLREAGHTAKRPQGGRLQGLTLCHGDGLALKVGTGPASYHLAEPSPSS